MSTATKKRARAPRKSAKDARAPLPKGLARVFPFFTSAVFFLSAVFCFFAPLPLLALNLGLGRRWGYAALFVNSLLIYILAGPFSLGLYALWVATVAILMPEGLRRGLKVEWIVVSCLGAMAILGMALAYVGAASQLGGLHGTVLHPMTVLAEIRAQVIYWVDQVGLMVTDAVQRSGGDPKSVETVSALAEWKDGVLTEFPSAIGIFSLVLVWLNLVMVLRLNPAGVRARVGLAPGALRLWKASEWLVWPTVAAGAGALFLGGAAGIASLNILRFLLAIYVLQGIGILAFVLDRFKVRGWARPMIFIGALLIGVPLILAVGFFDLWFDFRSRIRQR